MKQVASLAGVSTTTVSRACGLPALSVPFAFSSEQLPINIQLVSRWLDEATILRLGALLDRSGGLSERRPSI